jgi:hypothetical protein
MNRVLAAGFVAAALAFPGALQAQDVPKPPAATKEHEWLKQLNGEWDSRSEAILEPGKPGVQCKGTESTRSLGDFWIVGEYKGSFMDIPTTGVLTLGYDAHKKKFVGTWVCTTCDQLCSYEGSLDETGKILTLHTEMRDPTTGKSAKCKDVIEFKDKDHKVMASYMLGDDGKWTRFMTMESTRKK